MTPAWQIPMTREHLLHCARVYVIEARRRAHSDLDHGFRLTLLRWAGNARRRAMREQPTQRGMFA